MPVATDEVTQEVTASLGQRLREARQARGLSIDDVVHTLKFSTRQIEAVETDRMEVLPSSVFQRGLVRSYARLLKLDPEPLLALIEAQVPVQEPEIRAPENMGNAAPKGGIFQIPPLVAISILLLIAAGVMIGWHYLGFGVHQVTSVAQAVNAVMDESKAVEVAKTEPQPATAPVLAPNPEPVVPAVVVPVVAPAAPKADVPAVAPQVVLPAPPIDGRRLSFLFSGESWIEVKDASGLVILTGIYQNGTQSVVGRPPFEVVIGNAAMVSLRDNGRSVDLKPFTRAEVARLTLK
jgi:cytoskeleton protein RodZ